MDQHPEIRPALGEVPHGATGGLPLPRHALEENDQPRGHARDEADVLGGGQIGYRVDTALPVRDGADPGTRRIAAANTRREPTHDQAREISDAGLRPRVLEHGAAPEEHHRAVHEMPASHPRARHEKGIPTALAVGGKRLTGHRDHLVAGGGPRGLHPVAAVPRPRHAPGPRHRAGPQRLEVGILTDGHTLLVLRDRTYRPEAVLETKLGVARRPE